MLSLLKVTKYPHMSKIKLLSNVLISKIAAGEVVERPASVVKELMENSIDAKSTKIIVKFKDSGIRYIEVEDNGIGIDNKDIELVLLQHATSKIQDYNDLYSINSMGFRGEALASISSVAEITSIDTKTKNSKAIKLIYKKNSNEIINSSKVNPGTKITIQNLFKNVPARKKFLKTESTEKKHIHNTFLQTAFPFLNIHFELYNDSKLIYRLTKTDDLKNRVFEFLGKEFTENSSIFNSQLNNLQITGVLGNSHIGSKTYNKQHIYVNNRAVKSSLITSAVKRGYEGQIHKGLNPAFIILLNIDSKELDVNIHPRKLEVKFQNEREVFSSVYNFILKHLEDSSKDIFIPIKENNDLLKKPTGRNRNFTPSPELKKSLKTFDFESSLSKIKKNHNEHVDNSPLALLPPSNIDVDNSFKPFQFFNTYIVFEHNNEMLFIDQHAAAEKILFEKLLKSIKKIQTKPLLIPEIVNLKSTLEKNKLLENLNDFIEIGFNFDDFGDNSIQILEIPEISEINNFYKIIEDFLKDEKELGIKLSNEVMSKYNITKDQYLKIATLACHGSIRAGEVLDTNKMLQLIYDTLKLESSAHCPHGRPILWKLTKKKLEMHFNRDM